MPSARYHHSAVWTGTNMIVWGGSGAGSSVTNTGGVYVPASDTWLATLADGSAPTARDQHTAVWDSTNAKMIVWGGSNVGALNTGSRYNPSNNTWAAVDTIGTYVPTSRTLHSAVYTGSRMIIWGGNNAGVFNNTGSSYDPALDTWSQVQIAGSPSIRNQHTAVWTGSDMIVWGGYSGSANLNTGGIYNVAGNSWTATSVLTNVPVAREAHSAVWTGTEMIIFGGTNGSALNSGSAYNAGADTWSLITISGNARQDHEAAWTGSKMVIWGGNITSGSYDTGEALAWPGNTWTPIAKDTNTPVARGKHTAVWTGSAMLVFGGYNGRYVATGATYVP